MAHAGSHRLGSGPPLHGTQTEYFAYVEAIDTWGMDENWANPPKTDEGEPGEFKWLRSLVRDRTSAGLAWPTDVVWLDCVRADYLTELPWRDEPCDIGNEEQSRVRRQRLLDLDDSRFRIVLLLVGPKDIGGRGVTPFAESLWHRVTLGTGALPVMTAADYEFTGAEPTPDRLQYQAECTAPERGWLYNVFNLNFLPDLEFGEGGGEGQPPTEPGGPGGGGRGQQSVPGLQSYATQALLRLKKVRYGRG